MTAPTYRLVTDKVHLLAWAALVAFTVFLALQLRPGRAVLDGRGSAVHISAHMDTCSQEDPVSLYTRLYSEYKDGLMEARGLAAKFCANASVKASNMPHYHHCLTGILESEVLYLRLRCLKPAVVTEVSSALGYSSLWILTALHHNGHGVLHSFDVFDTQFPYVLGDDVRGRWKFHKGDMQQTFPPVLAERGVDYLHIDTCHDDACVKMYLRVVVSAVAATVTKARPVYASAHDIYSTFYAMPGNTPVASSKAPLPEGVLLLQWLSFTGTARHMHTMAAGVSDTGQSVQVVRQDVLGQAASTQLDTWSKWKGKDYTSSVYFQLLGLDNMCTNCLPKH